MQKKWLIWVVIIITAPLSVVFALTAAPQVQLNEIVSAPVHGEAEWVEIYNASDDTIALDGWQLHDAIGKIFTLSELSLAAGEWAVLTGWRNKLNNTGDTLTLRTATGEIIDTVEIPRMTAGSALARFGNEWEQTRTITPRAANERTVVPPTVATGVQLSEVVSAPLTGEAEWVEVFNSSDAAVDISRWQLHDAVNRIFTVPAETVLAAGEWRVLTGWRNRLNNSGDTLTLRTTAGSIADSVEIPRMKKGTVLARFSNEWQVTTTATPAASNQLSAPLASATRTARRHHGIVSGEAHWQGVTAAQIELVISEVQAHGKPDFVELYCRSCDRDLAGLRVGVDKTVFEFPYNTVVPSGTLLTIWFGEVPAAVGGRWNFVANSTGLTGTDETVFVVDWIGQPLTAVCWANQNGKFSPGERNDVNWLRRKQALICAWCSI